MNVKALTDTVIHKLKEIIPEGVFTGVKLSSISRWKIGGLADCIVKPSNSEEVSLLINYLNASDLPYIVIGSTSNLLFSDKGLRVVAIQIGDRMSDYQISGNTVWTQAGKWVPGLARNVAQAGLSGIEHTAGIPGTIGGLICMNGGSQRKGIGSHVKSVTAVSPNGDLKTFTNGDCEFKYRSSVFQENDYTIVEAELEINKQKEYSEIRDEMLEILRSRRTKFPQRLPNCGSTFISDPQIYEKYGPPGAVIENLGYKGFRKGDAVVSKEHANFINNEGNAKALDVLWIIKRIRDDVYKETGFNMEAEVKYINEQGELKQAHLI
jgi:UDP-N-acetylmuramate dehydrogenase